MSRFAPMIDVVSMSFSYPGQKNLFEEYNWQVEGRETWAVVGPSGCGKSTLLYLLAGLLSPTKGCLRIGGGRLERPRPETGLILQDYGLLPWATVVENAALGLRLRRFYGPDGRHAPHGTGVIAREIAQRTNAWLTRLGIGDLGDQYPGQLSGGQRQRVAIARTLVLGPDLLLMDEPFSSLDALAREDLEQLTVEVCAETGVTAVIVTHSIEEAVFLGERILVLQAPPNRNPLVVKNPDAGAPGFRNWPEFSARCSELRRLLEANAHAEV